MHGLSTLDVADAASATDIPAVEVRSLVRRYGTKTALDRVDLVVPARGVIGIVGENGAGKSTLIKHILGLLRAQEGSVRVFGLDPVAAPEQVLARIGFLAEEPELPAWMTVGEYLRYMRSFYPTWDEAYAARLVTAFALDPARRLGAMSKGQRARTGLVAAQAHRPDLLLLDEPSSGLDPIVRRDILEAVLRRVGEEGRAVVFSSHLLNEVESVCDRIVMISKGRVVLSDSLAAIRAQHHFIEGTSPHSDNSLRALGGLLSYQRGRQSWNAIFTGSLDSVLARLGTAHQAAIRARTPSLDEIFVARSGDQPLTTHDRALL